MRLFDEVATREAEEFIKQNSLTPDTRWYDKLTHNHFKRQRDQAAIQHLLDTTEQFADEMTAKRKQAINLLGLDEATAEVGQVHELQRKLVRAELDKICEEIEAYAQPQDNETTAAAVADEEYQRGSQEVGQQAVDTMWRLHLLRSDDKFMSADVETRREILRFVLGSKEYGVEGPDFTDADVMDIGAIERTASRYFDGKLESLLLKRAYGPYSQALNVEEQLNKIIDDRRSAQ